MVKYKYDVEKEVFVRVDNRGRHLYVNIVEANRIVNMINLGQSVSSITEKVRLSNPKGTFTTINSFIKNYKLGNIEMPVDAPAPVNLVSSMTNSDRLDELEERVSELENKYNNVMLKTDKKSLAKRVKSWL